MREVGILNEAGDGFTSKDILHNIGLIGQMSMRTIRRELNKEGLNYLHMRKKGVLLPGDLKIRSKFAKKCKRLLPRNFWKDGVSMFLDGVGFEY